jgi:hypothetical protein
MLIARTGNASGKRFAWRSGACLRASVPGNVWQLMENPQNKIDIRNFVTRRRINIAISVTFSGQISCFTEARQSEAVVSEPFWAELLKSPRDYRTRIRAIYNGFKKAAAMNLYEPSHGESAGSGKVSAESAIQTCNPKAQSFCSLNQ